MARLCAILVSASRKIGATSAPHPTLFPAERIKVRESTVRILRLIFGTQH
jgi:hypothetical protein